jgi:alpha-L-fucosidase
MSSRAEEAKPLAERQQEFLSWKYGMFMHFNVATFNDREWANGYEDPKTFAPDKLNCGQWADAAKAAGMKYAVLTVKHTGGWCLWPSKYTTHGIQSFTNYKNGKGDIVREFVDAFRARGLKVGLYYCFPGTFDNKYGNKLPAGKPSLHGLPPEAEGDYVGFIKKQLTELLTNYGPIDLVWIDQYNNGYTGRKWGEIKAHMNSLQPDCLVIANNSLNFNATDIHSYEYPYLKKLRRGKELPPEGNTNPAEVCDYITKPHWFWNKTVTEKDVSSAADIAAMVRLCNSRQANYLLNVPPDATGQVPEMFVTRLKEAAKLLANPETNP